MQTMLAAIRRRCSPRPTTLPYYHYHYYNYYFCSHPSGLNIQESPPAAPKPSSSAPAAAAAAELIRNRSYCSCSRSIRFSSIPSIQHPSRHHRRRHCAVHHQHHDVWFSTISSSSSSPALDVKSDPLAIKVTVTGSNHENSNSRAAAASSSTCASTTTTSSTTSSYGSSTNNHSPTTTKSSDQIAEEEILSLQSELRIHFRHASYETALDIAKQLLSRTVLQFGNLHPATASAYNNLGLMNKCLGKYVEAKDAYHEALRIYGTNIIACLWVYGIIIIFVNCKFL
jgi:tetratricopeptide (TPR) repeat protein